MSLLLERLKKALHPRYRVERQLASGGMGLVFDAWDTVLERRVAIKVIRPELATARSVDRFLREARTLASFRHPNIVPIHDSAEADGLLYYVMDYLEGETLAQRLARGRLSIKQVTEIGLDVLSGLEAAHARGVIHRDVKPANIFLLADGALLGDFGISRSRDMDSTLTTPGHVAGTAAYMPPEQAAGSDVSERTDLYALAMALYEAATGRRWPMATTAERADWSGCPRPLMRVLERALAWSPDQRWERAHDFREALLRARKRPRARQVAQLVALALASIVLLSGGPDLVRTLLSMLADPSERSGYDVVILPFDVVPADGESLGVDVARIATLGLERVPDFRVVSPDYAFRWSDARSVSVAAAEPGFAARALRAHFEAQGMIARLGDSIVVRMELYDSLGSGRSLFLTQRSANPLDIGDAVALELLKALQRDETRYRGAIPSASFQAVVEFLRGENDFQKDAWDSAERHYEAAVARDSAFALAIWRLANVRRWLVRPRSTFGLEQLQARYRDQLSERDRELVEAQLTPIGEERLQKFEEARRRDPLYGYAALLHGDELFHRGPLSGHGLEEAEQALAETVARDVFMTPAYEHHAWVLIRLGERDEAEHALRQLTRFAAPSAAVLSYPALLRQAFEERFNGSSARASRRKLLGPGTEGYLQRLAFVARAGLSFDLPETQIEVGRELAGITNAGDAARANGHVAEAIALFSLGRGAAGLAQIDSAAELLGTPRARLERAEWRVIPSALGLEQLIPAFEIDSAREALGDYWTTQDSLSGRAAWALALDAFAAGDSSKAIMWRERLRTSTRTPDRPSLERIVRAREHAAAGRYAEALAVADSLDPATLSDRAADPFLRAVVHLLRGDWRNKLEDNRAAERQWLWSENQDIADWATPELRAVDVDWALSPYAAHRRAPLALARGDTAAACEHLARVVQFWSRADASLRAVVEQTRITMRACRP